MKQVIKQFIKKHFFPKSAVLMYHSISEPRTDVWEIAVSPENFEQELQVLKRMGTVVPLDKLVKAAQNRSSIKNSIAITFDDGYLDNFVAAKPLLEKYELPATFFIASGNIGSNESFWWDELEHLILATPQLPSSIDLEIGGTPVKMDLSSEQKVDAALGQQQPKWKACTEPPPDSRSVLYYKLWELIKPLPYPVQQQQMKKLKNWSGINDSGAPKAMSLEQLKELASNPLFTIGAHTVSHIQLAAHQLEEQKKELEENRQFLRQVTGQPVDLLAYPYGNYNGNTLSVVPQLGFHAAFCTEEIPLTYNAQPYCLPRFQVKNCSGQEFAAQLQQWLKR